MSMVILARGHGSGSVDRQCNNSEVRSAEIEQYGLSEGAFNLPGATAPESYMERAAVAEGWQEVSGSPFIIKVHDTPRTSLYFF